LREREDFSRKCGAFINYCPGQSSNKNWGKTKGRTFTHWIFSIAASANSANNGCIQKCNCSL